MQGPGESDPGKLRLLDKKGWHLRFDEQVQAAEQIGFPLSVLFVDVNRFKDVNDTLGHSIGDEVLEKTEGILGKFTSEFLVGGHIGGDEFAISGFITEEDAATVKENLNKAFSDFLEQPENRQLKDMGIGLAIGMATHDFGMTASELKTLADEDMYKEKLGQLPELTEEQFTTLSEARLALAAVGLRLRDIQKYEKILPVEKDD